MKTYIFFNVKLSATTREWVIYCTSHILCWKINNQVSTSTYVPKINLGLGMLYRWSKKLPKKNHTTLQDNIKVTVEDNGAAIR